MKITVPNISVVPIKNNENSFESILDFEILFNLRIIPNFILVYKEFQSIKFIKKLARLWNGHIVNNPLRCLECRRRLREDQREP